MPDELLSIQDSSLQTIADAIKDKCGISRSTKLAFPGDANTPNSFVGALKGIETEVTITPKITPQQKTLTPSETSFSISPGFHNGTGTVKIQFDTTNNSATPSSSQQTITPETGKFFRNFVVGGMGDGWLVVGGETISFGGNSTITISGLPFTTPETVGAMGFLSDPNNQSVDRTAYFQSVLAGSSSSIFNTLEMSRNNYKIWTGTSTNPFSYSNGTLTISPNRTSGNFVGKYRYIAWGK